MYSSFEVWSSKRCDSCRISKFNKNIPSSYLIFATRGDGRTWTKMASLLLRSWSSSRTSIPTESLYIPNEKVRGGTKISEPFASRRRLPVTVCKSSETNCDPDKQLKEHIVFSSKDEMNSTKKGKVVDEYDHTDLVSWCNAYTPHDQLTQTKYFRTTDRF